MSISNAPEDHRFVCKCWRAFGIAVFFFLALASLSYLCDRDGYEGDDLNSIVPMFHLSEAKRGELLIYRYAWQPLSYELGSSIFRASGSPTAVFLLAPFAGAVSLTLLLSKVWRHPTTLLVSLIALFAVPELWFSGLYFNSTIIGLPFAVVSLIMICSRSEPAFGLLAGISLGIAILMRLDFMLTIPILSFISWRKWQSMFAPINLVVGVSIVLTLAFVVGIFDPIQVAAIYRSSTAEIVDKANTLGWDRRAKLLVLTVLLSPIGWAIALIGAPIAAYKMARNNLLCAASWMISVAPLAIPLPNLLSVKYAIPLLVFMPEFLILCLSDIQKALPSRLTKAPIWLAGIGTIALMFISFNIKGSSPYLQIGTLATRPIGTHDGERSYGGFLWQVLALDRFAARTKDRRLADCMKAEFERPIGPDIIVVGGENYFEVGGIGWRHLQLELEKVGIRGKVKAQHEVQFDHNGRSLTLLTTLPLNIDARAGHPKIFDLRETVDDLGACYSNE
jgi:hypothetical protein